MKQSLNSISAIAGLPILDVLDRLTARLRDCSTVILEAPPGAGKSTVVPIALMQEPWLEDQKIIMLEPRRLAAKSVATRMAFLLDEPVGKRIGYRVRFETKVSRETQVEVVTEGILTRMLQSDNALEGVGAILFDEFHERSLAADLSLALTREAQQILRPDLRVLIMSATLETGKLAALLGDAPVVVAQGRQYPVTLKYVAQDETKHVAINTAGVVRQVLRDEQGDVLVFLPGAGEIHRTAEYLQDLVGSANVSVYPLYGDLSPRDQQAAITPESAGRRKVVLATSIAETSLTIEGIGVVVDSGYTRVSRFDPRTGLSKLETVRTTRDAADQRAGRAGRLGPGVAYRLWSEASHHTRAAHRQPEILDADLTPLALELAHWGVRDPNSLAWLTPPPAGTLAQAYELLERLEAIEDGVITERGREMLKLPTHPRIAHMLIEGKLDGLLALATDVAALLEERDPFERGKGADLALRVDALRRNRRGARPPFDRIERLAASWRRLFDITGDDRAAHEQEVGRLIAAAYPERIAKRVGETTQYRLASGRVARLQDNDPLAGEEWLAIAAMDAGQREGKVYLAAALDPADIASLARSRDVLEWDSREGVIIARRERRIGEITIESKTIHDLPSDKRVAVLLTALRAEGLRILPWTESAENWRARVMSIRAWRGEEGWPDVSDQGLLDSLEEWVAPYITDARKRDDFSKLDLSSILRSRLDWNAQQELDSLAPATISVPSGSNIRLEYFPDGRPPVLSVRLQEMFGLTDTPCVNGGRTPVLIHLLSPGYKPVQITQDLKSFWQNGYPEVRKELRLRYPRHSWPEDPWTAEAVRGARRRSG